MSRTRTPLPVDELRQLADKQAIELNELVDQVNAHQSERALERLDVFVDMALASLELSDLVKEYVALKRQLLEVESRFNHVVQGGNRTRIEEFLPENRARLIERIHQRDQSLPPALYSALEYCTLTHGVEVGSVTKLPRINSNELLDRLRLATSIEEIKAILARHHSEHTLRITRAMRGSK